MVIVSSEKAASRRIMPNHRTFLRYRLQNCATLVFVPIGAHLLPQRGVVGRLQVAGHELAALRPLPARHIQVRKLVTAAKRFWHVTLHHTVQIHAAHAVVGGHVRVDRRINGYVDRLCLFQRQGLMKENLISGYIPISLRRKARRLIWVDVYRDWQPSHLRVIRLRGLVDLFLVRRRTFS